MRLATKYLLAFAGVATSGFVCFAATTAYTTYRESVSRVAQIQQEQGKVLAVRISEFLSTIVMQLREVSALPWASGLLGLEDERAELHRLLKLNPPIHAIWSIDRSGKERNYVSRTLPDAVSPEELVQPDSRSATQSTAYGPVYFKQGSTPFVLVTVGDRGPDTPRLVAEISLRYVTEIVADAKIGEGGRAFVIDDTDQLVAHPSLSLVHRKTSLNGMPQVEAAHSATGRVAPTSIFARSPESGREVLTSSIVMSPLNWVLFVEEPVDEVMKPVFAALFRTLWLLALLLAAGLAMSRWLAKRLTRPILALHEGAAQIGRGEQHVRVDEQGDDELAALAREFNHMAQRLASSYSELEDQVEARTHELATTTEELRVQATEAMRANAAKTRFLATASHDLRQPLQAISLLVEILRGRASGQGIEALVAKIHTSVESLETLFVSLLDLSHLDAGAVRPQITDLRVSSLLRLIESNFLPQATAHGLALRVMKCEAIVRTDAILLERIVSNLVANAVRYTPSGRIVVGCRRRTQSLELLVIDTGPGIAEHLHEEIFEEFFQAPSSDGDRPKGKGLGLGLSIVKRTAEILGHPLTLRSRVGHGSTFGIELPLAAVQIAAVVERGEDGETSHPLAGFFVAVIDDDDENRFAIEALCAQWGCHVVSASSADVVLRRLHDHLRGPDLLITDYRLARGANGIEAIYTLRAQLEEPSLPAIVMTGDLSVRHTDFTQIASMTLLHKPINADKLKVAAHRLLNIVSAEPSHLTQR